MGPFIIAGVAVSMEVYALYLVLFGNPYAGIWW